MCYIDYAIANIIFGGSFMDNNQGKLLYEYSDATHALDMSKHERRRYIKSFTAIWILICVLLLTVWCIVNCVLDMRLNGNFSVIKYYVMLFVILGVIILITVLTVFGLWGTFMRKVSKVYRPHEIESRRRTEELQREFETVDRNKSRENALMIFDDRIVVKKNGEERVIDKNELSVCTMIKSRAGVFLVFNIGETERLPASCMPPASDAYLIKKYLGDKLNEIKVPKSGRRKKNSDKNVTDSHKERVDSDTEKSSAPRRSRAKPDTVQIETGSLFAGIICIFAGIAISCLGYFHVMGDMPAVVGGFPIGLGVIFVVLAFHRYELVNVFVIKIAVAALLIFMGFMFLFIIEEGVTKSPVTVSSLLRHPSVYAIICMFFVSVGISIIPNAVKSLIEYFKYR